MDQDQLNSCGGMEGSEKPFSDFSSKPRKICLPQGTQCAQDCLCVHSRYGYLRTDCFLKILKLLVCSEKHFNVCSLLFLITHTLTHTCTLTPTHTLMHTHEHTHAHTHTRAHEHCGTGYQPIRILYPDSNQVESLFNNHNTIIPICNAYLPLPESATTPYQLLAIKSNSQRTLLPITHPREAAAHTSEFIVAAEINFGNFVSRILLYLPDDMRITEAVFNDLRQQLEDQQYVCTFSNRWESISVTFNLTLHTGIHCTHTCFQIRIDSTQFLSWQSC